MKSKNSKHFCQSFYTIAVQLLVFPYLCLSFINVLLLDIPGHSKVSHFTRFPFSNQHVTSCKISVNDLQKHLTNILN